jgi:hypothetical protein
VGYSHPSLRDCSWFHRQTQDQRPGLLSAAPSGLFVVPSTNPRLTSWATLIRPFGTVLSFIGKPRTNVLGYSQPSLRDCSWFHRQAQD